MDREHPNGDDRGELNTDRAPPLVTSWPAGGWTGMSTDRYRMPRSGGGVRGQVLRAAIFGQSCHLALGSGPGGYRVGVVAAGVAIPTRPLRRHVVAGG